MQVKTGEYQVIPCYPTIKPFKLILVYCQIRKVLCMILKKMEDILLLSVFLVKTHLREAPIWLLRGRWNFIGDTQTSEIFFIQWQMVTLFYFVKESYI